MQFKKHNDVHFAWYDANDRNITPGSKFDCEAGKGVAPYVLVYKKRSDNDVEQPCMSTSSHFSLMEIRLHLFNS